MHIPSSSVHNLASFVKQMYARAGFHHLLNEKNCLKKKRFFFRMNKHRYFVEIFFLLSSFVYSTWHLSSSSQITHFELSTYAMNISSVSVTFITITYLSLYKTRQTHTNKSGQWLESINNQTFLLNTLDNYLSWKNTFAIISVFLFLPRSRLPFYQHAVAI